MAALKFMPVQASMSATAFLVSAVCFKYLYSVVQLYKEGSGDDRDIGAAVVFAVAEGLDEDAITAKETIAEVLRF